jgi:hypothetical protein
MFVRSRPCRAGRSPPAGNTVEDIASGYSLPRLCKDLNADPLDETWPLSGHAHVHRGQMLDQHGMRLLANSTALAQHPADPTPTAPARTANAASTTTASAIIFEDIQLDATPVRNVRCSATTDASTMFGALRARILQA